MVRYEFSDISIHESDVHSKALFDRERTLARAFVASSAPASGITPCPFSKSAEREIFFERWGVPYARCLDSWSVALASAPSPAVLQDYFHSSDLSAFRASKGYQDDFAKSRQALWAHQVEWIEGRVRRYLGKERYAILDWGAKAVGWVELVSAMSCVEMYQPIAPLPPIRSDDRGDRAQVVLLFDVLQRYPDPDTLFKAIYDRLEPGGLLLLTCRSGSGFDILTLRGASESIFPFDHIALPSPEGLQAVLSRCGFEELELTTPGLLDVELVRRGEAGLQHDQYFERYVLSRRSSAVHEDFQRFLQSSNLSSHMRAVARRPQ